jgi:predicted lipoprotein with Yx(FWY)xxD motif
MDGCTGSGAASALRRKSRLVTGALVLSLGTLALVPLSVASAAPRLNLRAATVAGHKGTLVDGAARTVYILTSEKGAKIECKGSCLTIWPPLLVAKSTSRLRLGAGVKGKIGFVGYSKTKKQVTFNSYPLYTFSGDTGALQAHGQGIKQGKGTWALAKAAAKSPKATAILKAKVSTGGYAGY